MPQSLNAFDANVLFYVFIFIITIYSKILLYIILQTIIKDKLGEDELVFDENEFHRWSLENSNFNFR